VCSEGWPPKPLFPPFRKCREWRDGKFTSTVAEKLPLTTQQLASAMGTPVTFSKTQCRGTGVTVDMQVSPVWVGGPCHRLWHPLPQPVLLGFQPPNFIQVPLQPYPLHIRTQTIPPTNELEIVAALGWQLFIQTGKNYKMRGLLHEHSWTGEQKLPTQCQPRCF